MSSRKLKIPGVFIPENIISTGNSIHLPRTTLTGGRKHKKEELSMQQYSIVVQNNFQEVHKDERVPSSSCSNYKKSLPELRKTTVAPLNITKKERQTSRSLESVESFESLQTECDEIADNLLLVWKVSRVFY